MRLSGALQKKKNSELSYREIVKNSSNDETIAAKQVTRNSQLSWSGGAAWQSPCALAGGRRHLWDCPLLISLAGWAALLLMNGAWSKLAPFQALQCCRESYRRCEEGHGGDGSTLGRAGNFKYRSGSGRGSQMAGVGSGPHLMGSSPGEGRVSLGLDLKESPLMGQKPTPYSFSPLLGG